MGTDGTPPEQRRRDGTTTPIQPIPNYGTPIPGSPEPKPRQPRVQPEPQLRGPGHTPPGSPGLQPTDLRQRPRHQREQPRNYAQKTSGEILKNSDLPYSLNDYADLFLNDLDFLEAMTTVHMNYLPYSTDHSNDCNQNSNSLNNTDDLNSYSGVVNLSSYHLSDSELSLLSKGLTFVCTPESPNTGVIFEDLDKFHCSIKRKLAIEKLTTRPTNFPQAPTKISAGSN